MLQDTFENTLRYLTVPSGKVASSFDLKPSQRKS